jgi:hypothetical protein
MWMAQGTSDTNDPKETCSIHVLLMDLVLEQLFPKKTNMKLL